MLTKIKKLGLSFVLTMLLMASCAGCASAASSTISFSIMGGTYIAGSTFQLPIYEDSGSSNVLATDFAVNYDPTQLKFLSNDYSSNTNGSSTYPSPGSVHIVAFPIPPNKLSGKNEVALLSFKALDTSSSSVLNFSNDSSHQTLSSDFSFLTPIWNSATLSFTPAAPVNTTPTSTSTPEQPVALPSEALSISTAQKLPNTIRPVDLVTPKADTTPSWVVFGVGYALVVFMLLVRWFSIHHKILARARWAKEVIEKKGGWPISAFTPISSLSPTDRPKVLIYRLSSLFKALNRKLRL